MSSQKNDGDENLTNLRKLLQTFQSSEFLKNLYWDVLSDLKEKPSFKQVREIVEKIIKKNTDELEVFPDSRSDADKKDIISQICSVTFAVDALFSKVLYMKLEKVYQAEILRIMEELKDKGNLPEEISSNIQISRNSSSDSPEKTKAKAAVPLKKTPVKLKKGVNKNDKSCDEGDSTLGSPKSITENKVTYGTRRKLSKKDIEESIKASKAITKQTATANTPQKKIVGNNVSPLYKSTETMFDKEDSDAESEISVGHLSIASVSSVHTSDLSSFDDEISVGSGDEEGSKKRLSLKYLQQICENGTPKLDKISNSNKPKMFQKEIKENDVKENNVEEKKEIQKTPLKKTKVKTGTQVSPEKTTPNSPESTSSEISTSLIPKRVRKPNSKYSSDNVVVHSVKVKERKKHVSSTDEKILSRENSPIKKRSRSESSEAEIPNKMLKVDATEGKKDISEKSALKPTKNSDSCKPSSSVRSLTSRRTAPVTLYSTS